MERRKFLQFGSVGVAAGLSGCIGPLPDPLGLTSNNDNDGEDDDQETALPNMDDVETPEYTKFIPAESQNDTDGVFGYHIDLTDLSDKFTNEYQDPYAEVDTGKSTVTLSTGNSLQSVQPTLNDGLGEHPGWNDLRNALKFSDEEFFGFEITEYLVLENALLAKSDIDEDYIINNWGLEDNGDQTLGGGDDQVALYEGWLIMTFGETSPSNYADIYDGGNSVDQTAEFGVYYQNLETGDVTTFDFGTDVITKNELRSDIDNMVSVATMNGDLQTTTHLTTSSELTQDSRNSLGSESQNTDIERRDHYIRVVSEW